METSEEKRPRRAPGALNVPVLDLTREIDRLRHAETEEEKRHRARNEALAGGLQRALSQRATAMQGLLPNVRKLAETVIVIRGRVSESAEGAFEAACTELAKGGGFLFERYAGAKRYEGFHQREDHEYGYGPRHGSIVFAVELTAEVRRRGSLALEEAEAAVRWLLAEKAHAESHGAKVR